MKRKNMTRNALFTSIVSLLLCVSMLVGTTFAWFTDSVTTGMNTIAAGNLDIELYANGDKVSADTKLFDDVSLWEPGVAVYENLEIKNEGTLALKYQMALNFGHENNLNGHKLSEVLKVAVIEDKTIAADANRAEVLAAAKAAPAQGLGTLGNFYMTGSMGAGDEKDLAVIIFWDPNDNATDNLYNANNGKMTSDGKPLHIEVGVNLQATQKTHENDSFGKDYDEFSSILPKATVNNTGAKTVTARPADNWNNAGVEMKLDTSFQFLPNETAEEAANSAYKYWHADYVISANKDVPANSMALAGYYKAFGDFLGTTDWISLTGEAVAAGQEVRLVEALGATVNYEEICQYANDGVGFLCGAADLSGANAGTTITVELRLYETTVDPANPTGNKNEETGKYEVIGKYTYTFGGSWINKEDGTVLFSDEDGQISLYDTANVTAVDYTVPTGVSRLGNYAFASNTTIETVTLPASVVDLGRAFDSNSSVKKVVLNEGLKTISSRAFKATSALEEVVIPSTVTVIADNAFQKSGIKEITIPASVETIGETAFGASLIETVTFEGNTAIQGFAFRGCTKLRTVILKGDDVTFVPSTLNGRNGIWFSNGESNNPGVNNITFYVENEVVAERVKTAMGVGSSVKIYIGSELYAEI